MRPVLGLDVPPRHPVNIGAALSGEQHQGKGGALPGADLPVVLVLPDFVIRPRSDFSDLRSLDAR